MSKQKVTHKGKKVKSKDRNATSKWKKKQAKNNEQQAAVKIFGFIVKKEINDI